MAVGVEVDHAVLFKTKKGGQEFGSDFAHIITLRDGRWLRFRDFFNSALAARTLAAEPD